MMTEYEILESIVPKTKVDSITFENANARDIVRVTVKYCVYDLVDPGPIGSWFQSKEYEKYFLIQERLSVRYEGENQLYQFVENRKTTEIAPSLESIVESPDGSMVKKFNFTAVFDIDMAGRSVKNLNFILTAKYDIDALEADLDIDLFTMFDSSNMRIGSDLQLEILSNREIVEIIRDGSLMYPIRDFRIYSPSILGYNESATSLTGVRDFQDRVEQTMVKIEHQKELAKQYLSDFWITRSSRGKARFMFIYDPKSYFMNNSPYRNFFKNMSGQEQTEVIANMEIPSLKILRKRVLKVVGSEGTRVVDYKDRETETTIVETSKVKGSRAFEQSITDKGRIRQIQVTISGLAEQQPESSIFDLALPPPQDFRNSEINYLSRNFFFLTGDDIEVATVNGGDYVYGVSIEVADNFKEYLLRKILRMVNSHKVIKEIHDEIYNSTDYDVVNNVYLNGKNIKDIAGEDVYTKIRSEIKHYISSLRVFGARVSDNNSIMEVFIDLFSEGSQVPLDIYSLRILLNSIESVTNTALASMGESNKSMFTKMLASGELPTLTSPRGATTPRGIIRDRFRATKYYNSINNVFSTSFSDRTYYDYLSNFSEYIDSNVLREINSLSADTDDIGLRIMDGASFDSRMQTELTRVFTSTIGDMRQLDNEGLIVDGGLAQSVPIRGPGSEYLLPAGVSDVLGTAVRAEQIASAAFETILDSRIMTEEERVLAAHNIVFYHQNQAREPSTILEDDLGMVDLSGTNIALEPNQPNLPRNRDNRNRNLDRIDRIGISQDTKDSRDAFEKYVYDKVKKIIKLPDTNQERLFSNTNFRERLNYSTRVVPEDEFSSSTPNLMRALMNPASELVRDGTDLLQGQATVYSELLMKLEFLEGFSNQNLVLSPIWKPLTLEEYGSNKNRNLLCRIRPSQYSNLGIRTTNSGIPVFDSYFIVKPVGSFILATPDPIIDPLVGLDSERVGIQRAYYDRLIAESRDRLQHHLIEAMTQMNERTEYTARINQLIAVRENSNFDFGPIEQDVLVQNRAYRTTADRYARDALERANQESRTLSRLMHQRQTYEL